MGGNVLNIPQRVKVHYENIPEEIKTLDRWVVWRYETRKSRQGISWTKPPYMPDGRSASHSDPSTWSKYDDVASAHEGGSWVGIGFVMNEGDDLVMWDLDNVLDDRSLQLAEWAEQLVNDLDSYTEVSPSGKGLRILVRGTIPKEGKNENMPGGAKLECYSTKRYATITGDVWQGRRKIQHRDVERVWMRFWGKQTKDLKKLLKDEKVRRLFEGDWQSLTDSEGKSLYNGDHSAADLALCRYLVLKFDGDLKKVDEVFRMSKLFRKKWDEPHYGDGRTYGQGTLDKAIEGYVKRYSLTDTGNALRFVKLHGGEVRYCGGDWYVWDGRRLERDELGRVMLLAKDVANQVWEEARATEDDEARDALEGFARKCESKASRESLLALAKVEPPIPLRVQELNADPELFYAENVAIEAGERTRPHRFEDHVTKISKVPYEPKAKAPMWSAFLQRIMPDQEVRNFLQRAVGYTMTGSVAEQVFFLCWGKGANGKSTFFEVVAQVMGDYFTLMPTNALMDSGREQHPTALYDLWGARMALASEVGDQKRFNEELLKQITGERSMKARRMHHDFVEFRSTAKLWIMGNHKPTVRGTDEGFWRRFVFIPFTAFIPENERVQDYWEVILEAEAPGVLNWALEGWREWRRIGLKIPTAVKAAVADYRGEMDALGGFLTDECVAEGGARTPHSVIYAHYVKVTEEAREYVMSSKAFSQKLKEKGFEQIRGTAGQKYWIGLRLKDGGEVDVQSEL